MHITRLAGLALAAVLLPLAGCSAQSSSRPAEVSGSIQGGAAGVLLDPTAHGPAPDVPGATRGGAVTVLSQGPGSTLDPSEEYTLEGAAQMRLTTRTLTAYQHREDGFVLVPDLATDLGQVSDDGLTWTFHLKPGIRYQDGSVLTAADIAYSLKRSFAPELPNGPSYQKQFFLDGGKYHGPYDDGDDFAGVEAPDDTTLVIHLARKFPDLPYFAAFPMFTGVPEAKDDKSDPSAYGRHPMATGPYQVSSFEPRESLVLKRNAYWDAATDAVRHQYAETWTFQGTNDPNVNAQRLIEDKGADRAALLTGLDMPSYRTLMAQSDGPDRVVTGTNPCTYFNWIDTRKVPDVRVRKAIGLAYPYDSVWKIGGLVPHVNAEPATSLLPEGMPGRQSYDVLGNGARGNGDPTAARKQLEAAGALGFELRWPYTSDFPQALDIFHAVKQAYEKAGFKITGVPFSGDAFFGALSNPHENLTVRPFQAWCSDWPSGATWIPALFDGALIKEYPDYAMNGSFLDVPEVNAAIDRIQAIDDPQQSADEWGRLDKLIMTKYYPVQINYAIRTLLVRGSQLGGVTVDPTLGEPFYNEIFVRS